MSKVSGAGNTEASRLASLLLRVRSFEVKCVANQILRITVSPYRR